MANTPFSGRVWIRRQTAILAMASLLWSVGIATAQKMPVAGLVNSQLLVVTPCGGKAGSTVEVTVTGQNLDDAQGLLFNIPGIKGERIGEPPPPAGDPKKPAAKKPMSPNQPPAAPRFRVVIPEDAPLGIQDVRVVTKGGVSNPRAFVVGDLAEVLEKEPNNDVAVAQRVRLNTTVTGAITTPTDIDYFVFAGKKGQRVVVSCLASSIDSRLHPGVELYDRAGQLMAFNVQYHDTDALLDATLPESGDYSVRLFGFTYTQGGPEHFYRLSISTAPWIDAIYPPMVEPGKPAVLTVFGRNLPGGKPDPATVVDGRALEKLAITVTAPEDSQAGQRLAYSGRVPPPASGLDGFEYRIHNSSGTSNPFLLTYARAPVVLDNQDNDTADRAQEVELPCEIAGRIEKKNDRDWYAFSAHKGEVYSIEAFGDRLGAPVDLYFVLHSPIGKQPLADLDDNTDVFGPGQFFTRTEDPPRFRFAVPADGRYKLRVASREASYQGDPRDFYRLRIAPEQPDFRLVLMPPSGISPDASVVRQGSCQYYTVFVWRLDGCQEEITVRAEGLPPGVTCPPQTIAPNSRQATLVVCAEADAEPWTGEIRVTGSARIAGKTVVREARAASITWPVPQLNIVTVSRLDRSLVLAVRGQAPYRLTAGAEEIKANVGGQVTIPVKLERSADFKGPVLLSVLNLPPNVNFNQRNQPIVLAPDKKTLNLQTNLRPDVPPGKYTIVLRGETTNQPGRGRQRPGDVGVQCSPPLLLTILPKVVASVAVTPPNPMLKAGDSTKVRVKVTRAGDFQGVIKVQLVVPPKVKGISADDVTLTANQEEAALEIQADEEAQPGNYANLIVRATAAGKSKAAITQEAKIAVKVVK
jgi:hypothetical protein